MVKVKSKLISSYSRMIPPPHWKEGRKAFVPEQLFNVDNIVGLWVNRIQVNVGSESQIFENV